MFKLKSFALAALPVLFAAFTFNGPAQAAPLAADCLGGSTPAIRQAACERLHLYHYVLPHMQRELSALLGTPHALIPIPICAPVDCPLPWGVSPDYIAEHALILQYLGDPSPQPSYPVPVVSTKPVSDADQLKGAMVLRAALQISLDRLDQQIAELKNAK
jgi:hypothetical protein